MNRLFPGGVEREIALWLSERAQRQIWWTLVAFAILDWTHPQWVLILTLFPAALCGFFPRDSLQRHGHLGSG